MDSRSRESNRKPHQDPFVTPRNGGPAECWERIAIMMLRLLGNPDPSLAVGHPDILHLSSMLEEPAPLTLLCIEPIEGDRR